MWAWIDSAVLAQGYVVVDGRRKTVQHLEGGILRELLVREGDRVRAGQTLARLDPVKWSRPRSASAEDRLFATRCRIERLLAERDDRPTIVWSERLRDPRTPAAREVRAGRRSCSRPAAWPTSRKSARWNARSSRKSRTRGDGAAA